MLALRGVVGVAPIVELMSSQRQLAELLWQKYATEVAVAEDSKLLSHQSQELVQDVAIKYGLPDIEKNVFSMRHSIKEKANLALPALQYLCRRAWDGEFGIGHPTLIFRHPIESVAPSFLGVVRIVDLGESCNSHQLLEHRVFVLNHAGLLLGSATKNGILSIPIADSACPILGNQLSAIIRHDHVEDVLRFLGVAPSGFSTEERHRLYKLTGITVTQSGYLEGVNRVVLHNALSTAYLQ